MSIFEETANASNGTDNLRTSFYNSLDEEQRDDYSTQKCLFWNELRKNNIFCDVTLVSENDVEIKAHKLVLSGVSQYFFAKFTKFNEDRVILDDYDSSTLESLVHYAYTNKITMNDDNIETILQAADYFGMENLKNVCCNFLSSTITLPNCFRIRSIADLYACESLLNSCDDFIKKHFMKVINDEKFLDFSLNHLLKIIQDDYLNVPSEMTVYTAVMKWIKFDLEKRQKHLYELMLNVRLLFLGRDRLSRLFHVEPLFENCTDIQLLFLKAFMEENSLSSVSLNNILIEHVPIPRVSYSPTPKLFVIGGISNRSMLKIVDVFDIRSNVWRSATLSNATCGNKAVSIRNKVFVTGLSAMKIFDMKTEKWVENVQMPKYRFYHASALLNDAIYLIGGMLSNKEVTRSVDYYCLKEKKWYAAPDTMESRGAPTAAVLNNKIYVVGGSVSPEPCDYVEYYDPVTSTWNYCKNMNYGRYGAAACVVDDLLYVVGGRGSGCSGVSFEVYDPVTDKWELLPDLPTPRAYHGVGYDNGYLFVVGGKWNDVPVSSIDVFCFDTEEWFTLRTKLSVARSAAAVVMAYESPN